MENDLKVQIILGSTRDGRSGEKVGNWIHNLALKRKDFTTEFIDLKDWDIKFIHDVNPPSIGKYSDPLVQKWAKKINEADAFIMVTPEYNHGYPAVLKNALDVIYKEWNNKPVTFVSYGGFVGGSRSVEQLRQVAIELQMAPIREAIFIPFIWQAFNEDGKLKNEEEYDKRVESMFNQLVWWANALKKARD
ncbi:MAG TPA: NAD(P)H-dependent oxidoreductase [Candidatus Nanoarchaeia archaeon]|nr:NAD(P)H-dependent oxidoreductase [Candidatus Nanoarchaeia archaeon]